MFCEKDFDALTEQFLREKTYLQNWAFHTIRYYKRIIKVFRLNTTPDERGKITQRTADEFLIRVREKGVSIGCTNAYIKGLNVLFGWMFETGAIKEKVRLRLLRKPKVVMPSFSDAELMKLVKYKPKTRAERRTHVMVLTLMDTGCRIDELLSLERTRINFDSLFIVIKGKGGKERVVPMSVELRRHLYRFLQTHESDIVFPTREGFKQNYQNCHRDFKLICERLRMPPKGFHALRRTFARNYLRNGGNLIYLMAALGHSRVETTKVYVEVEPDDLKVMHVKTSLLSRIR